MSTESSSSTQLVVFSLASPFHQSLQLNYRHFSFFDRFVTIKQKWQEGGKGGTSLGFGASVYDCAIVLAKYIEANSLEVSIMKNQKYMM
jgi:hypothetical protein